MKILLYIFALAAFIVPLGIWGWMIEISCGYNTSGSKCGLSLGDFFHFEFLNIALIPWCIAAICIYYAQRTGAKAKAKTDA